MSAPAKNQKEEPMQESSTNSQVKQYRLDLTELKKELDHLLTITDEFKVSSDTNLELKVQGKSLKIRQIVSHWTDAKKKNDPMIWYVESVCPGSPKMLSETMWDSKYRMEWDPKLSFLRNIQIDEESPKLVALHSRSKPTAGGLVSAREFVSISAIHEFTNQVTGCESIQSVTKSIEREDIPKQSGVVRVNVLLGGTLFEKLSDQQIEELKLPELMVAVDEDDSAEKEDQQNAAKCEWTRIGSFLQLDLGGWIPTSVINAVLAKSHRGNCRDFTNYVIEKRLGLLETDQ